MNTFFFRFANNLFFPLTLSGSLSYLSILMQSEFSGKDLDKRRNINNQINLFTVGVLLSLMVGWWISLSIHLSVIGVANVASSTFPGIGLFFTYFFICTALSITTLPILSSLYYVVLLGLFESFVGVFAHIGLHYLMNVPGSFLEQIPFSSIAIFGTLFGIALRIGWFGYKGA